MRPTKINYAIHRGWQVKRTHAVHWVKKIYACSFSSQKTKSMLVQLLHRFHLGLIVGSSRVLRSNDILYLHPLCLLGFFLDLGSASVDGLDEDWVCGLLDEAGAWPEDTSACALSIIFWEISPTALRAWSRSVVDMLGNILSAREEPPLSFLCLAYAQAYSIRIRRESFNTTPFWFAQTLASMGRLFCRVAKITPKAGRLKQVSPCPFLPLGNKSRIPFLEMPLSGRAAESFAWPTASLLFSIDPPDRPS